MFENFKTDLARYTLSNTMPIKERLYLIFEQGLWAIAVYRFGRWVRQINIPIIGFLLRFLAFLLFKWIEILTGISIPASAKIGRGFYIGHFGGIVLHSDVQMGENCSIGPGVLIGTRGLGNKGVAKIGNNVYIGVGVKVLGPITIGDGAKIGANAVVLNDIPAGATAIGIPAKILLRN